MGFCKVLIEKDNHWDYERYHLPAIMKENGKTGISKRYAQKIKVTGADLYH